MVHPLTDAYNAGYQEAIDKACEWLYGVRWNDYVGCNNDVVSVGVHKLVTAFRKALEE